MKKCFYEKDIVTCYLSRAIKCTATDKNQVDIKTSDVGGKVNTVIIPI